MSLLMDALRKAEQQKQQNTAPGSAASGPARSGLDLEPLSEQATASRPVPERAVPAETINRHLPELPKRLEELDDQFFTSDPALQKSVRALAETKKVMGEAIPSPAKPDLDTSREAVQNVFAAKQPAQTVGHGFAITVSIATLIAISAIGGYFYWQMQPKGGLAAGSGLAVQPGSPAPSVPPTAQPAPAPLPAAPAAPPVLARTEPERAYAPRPVPPQASRPAPEHAALPAAPEPDNSIRFNTRPAKADSSGETAHAAFTRGEADLARSIWLKTLQSDSRNLNALHGLAAIALQENQPDQAAMLYRRALEVDPKDAMAHAGLLSINAPADARQAESRLKGLLAEQPNSPHLHFALGNVYMNDSRWSEAQQAFFKAHVADPANPDYLYNLAVSLDHLHQTGLAAQYYARALVAAQSQAAAFDSAQVEERLRALRNERQH
ncbi:MAG: tetratricopeptide repeat protein [Pseudomonadota bacterium]